MIRDLMDMSHVDQSFQSSLYYFFGVMEAMSLAISNWLLSNKIFIWSDFVIIRWKVSQVCGAWKDLLIPFACEHISASIVQVLGAQ